MTPESKLANLIIMFSPLQILKMLYITKRPFMLNHKINIACDCRCKFCNSWQIEEDPETLLDISEIRGLLDQAKRCVMLSYSVWGGEPLLREDTPAALQYARQLGFFTTISTNGSLLAERADEFVPYTHRFIVSMDGLSKTHDSVRGFPGLFDKVADGIESLKKKGAKVRLFYNVNNRTIDDVAVAAELAKKWKVSIHFSPVLGIIGYNDNLLLTAEQTKEIFSEIISLKKQGYPVLNLHPYLKIIRDGSQVTCHFPRYHVYVDHDGLIYSCDLGPEHKPAVWGNIRETDLSALVSSKSFRKRTKEMESCNACRLSCGEIGAGSPLLQFPVRAWTRLRHEFIFQARARPY